MKAPSQLRSARGAGVLSLLPEFIEDELPLLVLEPFDELLLRPVALLEVLLLLYEGLPDVLLDMLLEGVPDVLPIDEPELDMPFDPVLVPFDEEPWVEALEVPPFEPALPEVCA